jgi:hypothetical protein
MITFGPKRNEVADRLKRTACVCPTVCSLTKYYYGDHIEEDEIGGACSAHGGDEKYVQNCGWKA